MQERKNGTSSFYRITQGEINDLLSSYVLTTPHTLVLVDAFYQATDSRYLRADVKPFTPDLNPNDPTRQLDTTNNHYPLDRVSLLGRSRPKALDATARLILAGGTDIHGLLSFDSRKVATILVDGWGDDEHDGRSLTLVSFDSLDKEPGRIGKIGPNQRSIASKKEPLTDRQKAYLEWLKVTENDVMTRCQRLGLSSFFRTPSTLP